MSELTTETLVIECRRIAEEKAVAMGNAGVKDKAEKYANLEFEPMSTSRFTAYDPNSGGMIDLLNMVLDTVEEQNPVVFTEHHDGGGRQTIYWQAA